jgi:FkbM family methyltransferase
VITKALRTAQHFLPGGRDRRETISRLVRRVRGRPHELDFAALSYFPPNQLMLDVGANYGQSITSMLLVRPDASVIAYEPNVGIANKVNRLFAADRRVTVQAFGLSDTNGSFDLFVPSYGGYPYPGLASLHERDARSWLSADALYFFRPRKVHVARFKCEVQTLDNQKLDPYFIKIDVQGTEFNVLAGGCNTLWRCEPILMIESPGRDPRIGHLLSPLGYVEFGFEQGHFVQRQSSDMNSFFITETKQTGLSARHPDLFRR